MSVPSDQVNLESEIQYHGDDSLKRKVVEEGGVLKDLQNVAGHLPTVFKAMLEVNDKKSMLDTRTPVFEVLASLENNSYLRSKYTTIAVDSLWSKLKHPPLSYLGDKFQYRTPDGSFNNVLTPNLGRAGTPYAKSVPTSTGLHGAKPGPGDLFDLLMARGEFVENPKGLSSVIFYHASIVIHDIFRTNSKDPNISGSSSYLDLSPLYGACLEDQVDPVKGIRKMEKGLLKPDCFAEKRLVGQPPGVGVLLIMYNRFHNHVAEQLLEINEGGRFSVPSDLPAEYQKMALKQQDEDLFNTARLITCGLYASISVMDYLRGFMGTHAVNTSWSLDPREDIGKKYDGQGVPRGIGNQVSVEFNLLYRFHSPISQRDDSWTQRYFNEIFQGEDLDTKPLDSFGRHLWDLMGKLPADPSKRAMKGYEVDEKTGYYKWITRNPETGKYDDQVLVNILREAIDDPAGAFGARNVPKILRTVEILGILQARKWQVCTLNELRTYFGMKPHATFEDINPDKEIAAALTNLYEHPDMVELYPGIFCEGNGHHMDAGTKGTGELAMWTGVFSDAVTLVRSDRFYTVDWNVSTLTAWGMKEVTPDPSVLKASMFYKLIQRAFPGWFKYDSIYLFQPMYTSKKNLELSAKQGFEKVLVPDRPSPPIEPTKIQSYNAILEILKDRQHFKNPAFAEMNKLDDGKVKELLKSIDKPTLAADEGLLAQFFKSSGSDELFQRYFDEMAVAIEKRERCNWVPRTKAQIKTYQIDIVRDFATPIIVRFVGDLLGIQLDGRTHATHGMSEASFYKIFTDYQHYLNYDADETTSWKRRAEFLDSMKKCAEAIENPGISASGAIKWISSSLFGESVPKNDSVKELQYFGKKLSEKIGAKGNGKTRILTLGLDGAYNTVMMFTEILNFFLEAEGGKEAWKEIQKLATQNDKASRDKITKYVVEAQRITMQLPMVRIAQSNGEIKVPEKNVSVAFKTGQKFVLDMAAASMDPTIFPDASKIKLDRDPTKYLSYNRNQSAEADKISFAALTSMIRLTAKMRNLRPTKDSPGTLKKVARIGTTESYMTVDWSEFVPYPTTWKLRYDTWDGDYVPYTPGKTRSHDMVKIWRPAGASKDGGAFNTTTTDPNAQGPEEFRGQDEPNKKLRVS